MKQTEISPFLFSLFPKASPELHSFFASAAEETGLLRSDFYTIRDWLEIAEYQDHPWLPVLLLVLLISLEEGSICIELSEASLSTRLTEIVGDEAVAWARRCLDGLVQDPCNRLFGRSVLESKPIVLHQEGSRRFLYFQKYLQAEQLFVKQYATRLQANLIAPDEALQAKILREVLDEQPLLLNESRPIELDLDQKRALERGLAGTIAIVSGGPGTGKTSIVLNLLRCLVRQGIAPERIALAAPTGRAAQRLSDALRSGLDRLPSARLGDSHDARLLGLQAGTLHQMLGYRPGRNLFTRHAENPIPADVVLVDEASMIGLTLMAQLFHALAPTTRLILIGDKDQLPSVDAGAVLASLVPDVEQLASHVVVLRTNHRSQQEIRHAAQAVNRRQTEILDHLPVLQLPDSPAGWLDLETKGGCWLLEQTQASPAELRHFIRAWIEQAYFHTALDGETLASLVASFEQEPIESPRSQERLHKLFTLLDRYRVLTLVREGPWGCVDINRFCQQVLKPRLDPETRGDLFAGVPVLVVRNDSTQAIFNGDVGITLRQQGQLRVVFQRQGSYLVLATESLPAHELGFALTVHKSQGSEYRHVLVVLPPEGGRRLLTKELVYTAMTRAKTLGILCGTKKVLSYAIGRGMQRESGMMNV